MKYAFGAIAIALVTTSAMAADLAAMRPVYAPAYDWSGFYVGAMGGYGTSTTQGVDFKGGFGGVTIGSNFQMGSLLIGIESELAGSNIGQTVGNGFVSVSDRIDAFGSVNLRAGIALERILVYGKGGYATAVNTISASAFGLTGSESRTHQGWDAGGGLEVALGSGWSMKGEYLYTHYFSQNYLQSIFVGGVASGDLDVHTGKIGVNYRFGGPVVARY